MNALPIEELTALRLAAKRAEDDAIAHRRDLDAQLADLLRDPAKPEGTVSKTVGEHKVAITYGITRKADTKALQSNWHDMSERQQGAFKWSAEVSLTGLRACDEDETLALSKFIESKPSSPQVKIEPVKA